METITAISSFSPEGWHTYAREGLTSLVHHFPPIEWRFYYEDILPIQVPNNVTLTNLFSYSPVQEFLNTFCLTPLQSGRQEKDGGYNVNRDAARFCRKVYAQVHAAQTVRTDLLIWCDADLLATTDISKETFMRLLPTGYFCSYLGRTGTYTETGFLAFRLTHPACQEFMERYAQQYTKGLCFQEEIWHDCRQFDVVRQAMEKEGKIQCFNLTSSQTEKHPVNNSPYLKGLKHYKGDRKYGFRRSRKPKT